MIAPRRALRPACGLAARAAARRVAVPGLKPLSLRWRRAHAAAGVRAVPGRLASCIVQLQQHLHVQVAGVNLQGWGAAATQAPVAGPPGMPGRDGLLAWSASGRALLPAASRAQAPGQPRTTPAARQAPPMSAGAAQAGRTTPQAERADAAGAAAALAHRVPAQQAGATAPTGMPHEASRGGPRAGLRLLPRPAPPLQQSRSHGGQPGTQRRRPTAPGASLSGALARRLSLPRAATPPAIAAPTPAILEWRRHAQGGTPAPGAAPWSQGEAAAPLVRHQTHEASAAAPMSTAAGIAPLAAPSFPVLDGAAADRLAEDVVRRVERRLRIERERRGL